MICKRGEWTSDWVNILTTW